MDTDLIMATEQCQDIKLEVTEECIEDNGTEYDQSNNPLGEALSEKKRPLRRSRRSLTIRTAKIVAQAQDDDENENMGTNSTEFSQPRSSNMNEQKNRNNAVLEASCHNEGLSSTSVSSLMGVYDVWVDSEELQNRLAVSLQNYYVHEYQKAMYHAGLMFLREMSCKLKGEVIGPLVTHIYVDDFSFGEIRKTVHDKCLLSVICTAPEDTNAIIRFGIGVLSYDYKCDEKIYSPSYTDRRIAYYLHKFHNIEICYADMKIEMETFDKDSCDIKCACENTEATNLKNTCPTFMTDNAKPMIVNTETCDVLLEKNIFNTGENKSSVVSMNQTDYDIVKYPALSPLNGNQEISKSCSEFCDTSHQPSVVSETSSDQENVHTELCSSKKDSVNKVTSKHSSSTPLCEINMADELDITGTTSDQDILFPKKKTQTIESENRNMSLNQKNIDKVESTASKSKEGISIQNGNDVLYKSRKNYCPYCLKLQAQLPRHMTKKHKEEEKVMQFMSYDNKAEERVAILEELRKLGNFRHNATVLRTGKGEILPTVRSKKSAASKDYVPCKNCLGFYPKKLLWRHSKDCRNKHKTHITGRRIVGHGLNLLSGNSVNEIFLDKIVAPMVTDKVNLVIRNDSLILKMGESIFNKHPEINKYNYIRGRMRELGRYLLVLREVDKSVGSLKDAIHPQKFKSVVNAVMKLSGFDGTSQFRTASLALKIGSHLKKCAEILSGMAMDIGNEEVIKNSEYFIKRYDREWADKVSSVALREMSAKKFNRPR